MSKMEFWDISASGSCDILDNWSTTAKSGLEMLNVEHTGIESGLSQPQCELLITAQTRPTTLPNVIYMILLYTHPRKHSIISMELTKYKYIQTDETLVLQYQDIHSLLSLSSLLFLESLTTKFYLFLSREPHTVWAHKYSKPVGKITQTHKSRWYITGSLSQVKIRKSREHAPRDSCAP